MATVSTFSGTSAGDIDSLSAVPSSTIGSISGITFPNFEGLLDTYPGAAAGYSVRRLATSATNLMRIREDAGDTETDIGYDSNNELDTAAIAAHCGSADGFVVTWFDQSINANDATQAASTTQPQIYDGATAAVIMQDGKPSVHFSSGSVVMNSTTSFFIKSYAYVGKPMGRGQVFGPNGSSVRTIDGTSGYRNYSFEWAEQNVTALHNGTDISSTNSTIAVTLSNDVVLFETSRSSGTSATQIGQESQQFISEAIAYPTTKSSSFSAMSAAINTFFSIYP